LGAPRSIRPLYKEKHFPDDRPSRGPKGRFSRTNPLESIKSVANSAHAIFFSRVCRDPGRQKFAKFARIFKVPPREIFRGSRTGLHRPKSIFLVKKHPELGQVPPQILHFSGLFGETWSVAPSPKIARGTLVWSRNFKIPPATKNPHFD